MRTYWHLIGAVTAMIAVPICIAVLVHFTFPEWFPAKTASHQDPADVKIVGDDGGHGSGVHIGNGYIITAAHVLDTEQGYTVKAHSGQVYNAITLWKAIEYDVALMRVDKPRLASADLDCAPLKVGDELVSKGNPYDLQFLTMRGYVASIVGKIARWHDAIIADISIAPGMSGGPVFNSRGHVVGINVGVRMASTGLGRAPTRFGVVVPSSAICALLTR